MIETTSEVISFLVGGGGAAAATALVLSWRKNQKIDLVGTDFGDFVENINEGYYRSSLDGKQLYANRALVKLNGYTSQEEMLRCVNDIAEEWYVDPSRRDDFARLLEADGSVENFVSEIYRHKTRERIWISENARLVRDRSGRPLYYEGTIREFTETMKRLELEALHNKLADQVPGVLVQARWSADGKFSIPYFSNGFRKILGDIPDSVMRDSSFMFRRVNKDDYARFVESGLVSAQTQEPWRSEFRFSRDDGKEVWIELQAVPQIEDDGGCLWHGILLDVTEKKNAEAHINKLAFYDHLTKLPNRRSVLDHVDQMLEDGTQTPFKAALLFLDLDNFKDLNDTRGHLVGDQLLVEVSSALKDCVGHGRASAGFVGRLGGDEFVVVLKRHDDEASVMQKIEHVTDCILKRVDRPYKLPGGVFHPSCSIGAAVFDEMFDSSADVLKNADTAMYAAKSDGKNCMRIFDDKMRDDVERSVVLMEDLRKAVGTDQLSLLLQMQVGGSGKVVGAEALLRWEHPKFGPISPADFIPAAENSGAIIPVTDWILDQAARTLALWSGDPALKELRLSVNISACEFHEERFESRVMQALQRHSAPANRLVLEMTEHVLSSDPQRVSSIMHRLKQRGIGFSLDDFGTGYSSLAQLRDLPFDELKIDGNFVRELETSTRDQAIVRSIIALSKSLNLSTVAEWVESEGQRDFLLSEGCSSLQGWLFGAAMPRNAFEEAARLRLFSENSAQNETLEPAENKHLRLVGQ